MKHHCLLLFTGLSLPALAFAQTKDAVNPETEKAVTQIEKENSAALMKGDAAKLETLMADSFYAVLPDGTTQNRAQFLADVKSGALKLETNELTEMKVQAGDADMAVVTYRSKDKGTYKGDDISGEYRWTDVLAKRDGKWLFILSHGTRIDTDEKP